MEDQKTSAVKRLESASNVLVTISANPSVDQLAAAIGASLFLNKLGKHATAVFSGDIPPVLEFLKPEETFEKNTDSLRDFIIALDKSKADKLRYKIEDRLVKIFITPYHTSLSQDDLEFSQGDFNVDTILAIGVRNQRELDQAITAHGRILHDATTVTLNLQNDSQPLGTLNWVNPSASSLCEMTTEICQALKKDGFDAQIATALLTGIVAETERFSNSKTTSDVMNISGLLMSAGANQQLVATKLEQSSPPPPVSGPKTDKKPPASANGALKVDHADDEPKEVSIENIDRGDGERFGKKPEEPTGVKSSAPSPARLVTEPPALGGKLTASGEDKLDPSTDPLSLPPVREPLLSRDNDPLSFIGQPADELETPAAVPPTSEQVPTEEKTLEQIEEAVVDHQPTEQKSEQMPLPDEAATPRLDDAREAVEQALSAAPSTAATDAEPIVPIGEQPAEPPKMDDQDRDDYLDVTKLDTDTGLPLAGGEQEGVLGTADRKEESLDLGPPPPVPPPILPGSFGTEPSPDQDKSQQT
jgi:hypothetical protein